MYVRSPSWVRRTASPVLALIPASLRFGKSYSELRTLIEKSEYDADFVNRYQSQQISSLLSICECNSSYYRDLIHEVRVSLGVNDDDPGYLLRQLPLLRKSDVRDISGGLLVKELCEVDIATTSGSSGRPLQFYLDKDRSVREWAFVHHLWHRSGYDLSHRRATLRGAEIKNVDERPWEYDPALNELRLSPFHMTPGVMSRYLKLISEYKIDYVHGYPSAIVILASFALQERWRPPPSLKGVFPISESFYPHQRELIRLAFGGIPIMMCYGLSEKSAIAGELLESPDTYEFEPLYGITELVDENSAAVTRVGQTGRIVATGFISKAMPLLRYDTGDIAELVRPALHDNCYRMRVKNIRSRWGQEYVISRDKAKVSVAAINIHSPVYALIEAFQFYQEKPGEVTIRVIPVKSCRETQLRPFVAEIQQKVGSGIIFTLKIVERLAHNDRGKRKFVDQRIPPESIV